eukprot:1153931-Pelagomonas_calceolata.AAC.9
MPPPTHWLQHLYSLPPSQLQQLGPQAVASTLWALATMSDSSSSSSFSKGVQLSRTDNVSSMDVSANGRDAGDVRRSKQNRGWQQQQRQQQQQQQQLQEKNGSLSPAPQGPSASSPTHPTPGAFLLPPPSWSLALLSSAHTYMLSTLHNSERQGAAGHASRSSPSTAAPPQHLGQQQQQQQLNGAGPPPLAKAGKSSSSSSSSSSSCENKHFGPQALANTVWAVYRLLGRPPSEEWMHTFYAASATQVGTLMM